VHSPPLPDAAAAIAWFDAEHAALLAAQHTAASHRWYLTVVRLAGDLDTFHSRRGRHHDQLVVWRAALDAVEHRLRRTPRITAHRAVGYAYIDLRRHDEGIRHLHRALALAKKHHNVNQQASTYRALAYAHASRGENRQALDYATLAWRLFRMLHQTV
jgi:tetratricopeptide (TPR) repeat protein